MKYLIILLMFFTFVPASYASYNAPSVRDQQIMIKRFEKVQDHVYEAAMRTGLNMEELAAIASLESKFVVRARNQEGTSAKGVLQYTNSTWASDRKKYAKALGLKKNVSVFDPKANLLIGAQSLVETRKNIIDKTHLTEETVRPGDIYMSHFLGEYGALKVINSKSNTPINKIVKVSGNYRYFYKPNGKIRTAREFRQHMNNLVIQEAKVYSKSIAQYQVARFKAEVTDQFKEFIDNHGTLLADNTLLKTVFSYS